MQFTTYLAINNLIIQLYLKRRLNQIGWNWICFFRTLAKKKMQLHLLRHGKAEPSVQKSADFERNLAPKGILQAQSIATQTWEIQQNDLSIHCSTSNRTRQTASSALILEKQSEIYYSDALYLADLNELRAYLWNLSTSKDVLLIGHNEGISDLASYFTGEFILLNTANWVSISFDIETWEEASRDLGKLTAFIRPKLL